MQFLVPLFFVGALALAVPILLHLVRKEKSDRVPFPSLMFLRRVPVKELRRQRLKYLFLLFLRCLGLFLLVMAFARPVITSAWLDRANPLLARSVLILIDNSMSMSRPEVWEAAQAAAREKIDSLRGGDEGMIVQFGESVSVLSQWERTPEKLREILNSAVRPSYESTVYAEGLRLAADQFRDARNAVREIFLLTDLQRSGVSAHSGWRLPSGIQVEVRAVGRETPNLYVEEARVEREVFGGQYPHPVVVRISRSPAEAAEGEAQLFLEGKLIDRRSFTLNESGTGQVTFSPFPLEEGITRGRIVVEPLDVLPADNSFFFVVERRTPRTVLLVSDQGPEAGFYLQQALTAGQNLPFQVTAVRPGALPRLNPAETPLLILEDLAEPPPASALRPYLERGGGVIVTLGNRARAEAYRQRWGDLLPVALEERYYVRTHNKPFTALTEVNWEHPVFSIFRDAQRASLVDTHFYGYWRLEPEEGAAVLSRFEEGDPMLVERRQGSGRLLILATSMDTVWTDFPLRSAFVPFWHRMAQYAAQWSPAAAALRVNSVLSVESGADDTTPAAGSGLWNVIDPRGQRVFGLDPERPGYVPLNLPGHYEIRSNRATDWVAVNPSAGESDLEAVPLEDFLAVFVPAEGRLEAQGVAASVDHRESRQSLWWIVLLAAALVFALEAAVANRYRAVQSTVDAQG